MAFELRIENRLSQSLVMTPQLQQAIKLLQLSRLELVETVAEEIETNPVLECEGINDTPTPEADAELKPVEDVREQVKEEDFDWQSYVNEFNDSAPRGVDFNTNRDDDNFLENITDTSAGLHEHLLSQLHLSGLDGDEVTIGTFILGNIDADGYLRIVEDSTLGDEDIEKKALTELAKLTGAGEEEVLKVLKVIHFFEPIGVGARSTRECLGPGARGSVCSFRQKLCLYAIPL
jgi:RNA polymerase sigma-54 factor